MMSLSPKLDKLPDFKFCNRHAFMASIALAKVHLNRLMITSIFGTWAFEPFPRPGKRLERLGLIEQKAFCHLLTLSQNIFHINQKNFVENFGAYTLKGVIK